MPFIAGKEKLSLTTLYTFYMDQSLLAGLFFVFLTGKTHFKQYAETCHAVYFAKSVQYTQTNRIKEYKIIKNI